MDPQIFISKSIYPLIFILVYPWIYRSVISADPQIPVSLHPQVHRSPDFWISGSMDLNITIFMHWQILVSLHSWILWPWYVYIPRSWDPNISTSMGPQIPGFLDLWIYGSSYHYIHALTDPCIFSSRFPDSQIFISLHPQIFRSQHPYIILSSYYFSTIIISFHTFLVLQVSHYNSFFLFFQYCTFCCIIQVS